MEVLVEWAGLRDHENSWEPESQIRLTRWWSPESSPLSFPFLVRRRNTDLWIGIDRLGNRGPSRTWRNGRRPVAVPSTEFPKDYGGGIVEKALICKWLIKNMFWVSRKSGDIRRRNQSYSRSRLWTEEDRSRGFLESRGARRVEENFLQQCETLPDWPER